VFNPHHPILLVGDDKGVVTSLKLSPNLRKSSKPEKGQKLEDLEVAKLEQVGVINIRLICLLPI
jgi:dynein intermediate chain 1